MQYKLSFSNGQLLVSLTGELTPRAIEQHFAQILNECAAHTQRHLYLDVRSALITCGQIVDIYNAFAKMAELYRHCMVHTGLYGLRIAAVVPVANLEALKFGETVAVNRGLPLMVTDDPNAAANWLIARN